MGEPRRSISSRHNQRFKDALALRDSRERRRRGMILVDGAREIRHAVAAGHPAVEAWVAPERIRTDEARAALLAMEAAGVAVTEVSPELLATLAYGDRDDGVVAVMAMPRTELDDLGLPEDPLVGVLEGVEKPGNLGAVLRSADGAAVDGLIVADAASDPWNANTIRASIGTVFSVPLATCSSGEALAFLRSRGLRIVAAAVDAAREWDGVDLRGGVAIVLGSEATGLSDTWRDKDVERVRIPMLGRADSLNVSATAAVLFYEALRQRRAGGA